MNKEEIINTLRQIKEISTAARCLTSCPLGEICLWPAKEDRPESWNEDYIRELADKFMKGSTRDD